MLDEPPVLVETTNAATFVDTTRMVVEITIHKRNTTEEKSFIVVSLQHVV
jgi:hypothetical protein